MCVLYTDGCVIDPSELRGNSLYIRTYFFGCLFIELSGYLCIKLTPTQSILREVYSLIFINMLLTIACGHCVIIMSLLS
jgi:hypothetical protein